MIIISDNQPLTCDALTSYLAGQPLRYAHNKADLIEKLSVAYESFNGCSVEQSESSILVILDFSLFDFSTPESFLIFVRRFPKVCWLLFSAEFAEGLLRVLGKEQTVSFLLKNCTKHDVLQSVYLIQNKNKRVVCQYVSEQLVHSLSVCRDVHLTPTEAEILSLIAHGLTVKAIAERRNSSVHTIVTHKKNIFRKIGVSTSYEAARYAFRSGIVDPVEYYI